MDIIDKNITVWFSCGAASAVAAKKTIEHYGKNNDITVVNNPVIEEHEDNKRFLLDVQDWLGQKIHKSINSKYPNCSAVEIFNKRKYMGGVGGAPCTMLLKKGARLEWELLHDIDWHVLGFTYEEKKRSDRFMLAERSNLIPVLIDNKITKNDCYNIITEAGLELPQIYKLGYPNANCIGCVKASSPTYWNHVRNIHPDIFTQRAEQSRRIGAKLVKVKGSRKFLDELKLTDVGNSMKTMKIDCGIFCEDLFND